MQTYQQRPLGATWVPDNRAMINTAVRLPNGPMPARQPERHRQPVRSVLVLDYSGSTSELLPEGISKLEAIKQGVEAYLNAKARSFPEDRVALVIFNEKPTLLASFARPSAPWVLDRCKAIGPSGNTNIASALDMGLGLLLREAQGFARRLTLLSDGVANQGRSEVDATVARAARVGVVIDAVGVGLGSNTWDEALLQHIGGGTPGGCYWRADSFKQLLQAFLAVS